MAVLKGRACISNEFYDFISFITETGVTLNIDKEMYNFQGTITVVSADNPASAYMGGFKQSASAFRFCRHCTGSKEDIKSQVCLCKYMGA